MTKDKVFVMIQATCGGIPFSEFETGGQPSMEALVILFVFLSPFSPLFGRQLTSFASLPSADTPFESLNQSSISDSNENLDPSSNTVSNCELNLDASRSHFLSSTDQFFVAS